MQISKIESYLEEIQKLSKSQSKEQLIQYIEEIEKSFSPEDPYHKFFQAEKAFYSGVYELALKNYLESKSIPLFHFFCYRASAYLSFARGHTEKAIKFANNALAINPEDYFTLNLLNELQKSPPIPSHEIEAGDNENDKKIDADDANENTKQNFSLKNSLPQNMAIQEPVMNQDFFSLSNNPFSKELANRLYSNSENEPKAPLSLQKKFSTLDLSSEPFSENRSDEALKEKGKDLEENGLETSIRNFQNSQKEWINQYIEKAKNRHSLPDHCLYILHGWNHAHHFLTEHARKGTGGYFLKWNGKGIVINPGPQFLKNFHEQGLVIQDIHYVIITSDIPEAYDDVKEIYALNSLLNKYNSDLHIIHYYLNQDAYQDLSPLLKPNFKQERHTVHPLELFLDSPDIEKAELSPGIILHYFPVSKNENTHSSASLGLRFELKLASSQPLRDKASLWLGYISNTGWSPLLTHYLGTCDYLITGFGNTSSQDYGRIKYNEDSLGYSGTYSLFEEIKPRMLICSEFGGREGDIRVEVVKKMDSQYSETCTHRLEKPSIFPGDKGLFIDLKEHKIACSLTKKLTDPADIRVVKTADSFGNLHYLSSQCCYFS